MLTCYLNIHAGAYVSVDYSSLQHRVEELAGIVGHQHAAQNQLAWMIHWHPVCNTSGYPTTSAGALGMPVDHICRP